MTTKTFNDYLEYFIKSDKKVLTFNDILIQWGIPIEKHLSGKHNQKSHATKIIGIKTSEGQEINGISKHAKIRMTERKVYKSSIVDAVKKPIRVLETSREGKEAVKYVGKWAQVIIGKEDGVIVTVYKTGKKTRNKYVEE